MSAIACGPERPTAGQNQRPSVGGACPFHDSRAGWCVRGLEPLSFPAPWIGVTISWFDAPNSNPLLRCSPVHRGITRRGARAFIASRPNATHPKHPG